MHKERKNEKIIENREKKAKEDQEKNSKSKTEKPPESRKLMMQRSKPKTIKKKMKVNKLSQEDLDRQYFLGNI